MNEELQSTNEELQTMNDELRNRSTELNANSVPRAIFTSMRSGSSCRSRAAHPGLEPGALDMWRAREEAQGNSLFSLDIGLPVGELHQPIREIISRAAGHRELSLSATNRRGKTIQCRVAMAPLVGGDETTTGVILLMEEDVPELKDATTLP